MSVCVCVRESMSVCVCESESVSECERVTDSSERVMICMSS